MIKRQAAVSATRTSHHGALLHEVTRRPLRSYTQFANPGRQKEATRRRARGATLQELAHSYDRSISTMRRATRAEWPDLYSQREIDTEASFRQVQSLENSGGVTAYGSLIALGLVVVLAALLIPLLRGRLKTPPFLAASVVLAFLVVFFWLWPTITEISLWKFGSIKTNVEQARAYLGQLKAIEGEVADIKGRIEADAARAQELQKQAANMRADLEKEIAARQPRLINPQQRARLVDELTKITPKGEVTVTWKLFDEEAERFGKQLLEVLNDSGFIAKEARGPFGFGIPGQWILVRDLKKYQTASSWVGALQAALNNQSGYNFDGQQMDPAMKPEIFGDVSIAVGAKP